VNNRKAFTLVELLVVIGIIAVLAGILLPAVNHMRRSAQIIGQKADFQTIASALESYKADFGDYPRNAQLPTWNTSQGGSVGQTHAPIFLSLATALLGPGPGVTQAPGTISKISQYEIGDGADGLGFRAQTMNIPVGGTTSYSVTLSLSGSPCTVTLSPTMPVQLNSFVPGQTVGSITMSVGMTYEETVGFVVDASVPMQLDLMAPPVFPTSHLASDKFVIKIPTGKITPNYLPADTFKVAFVPAEPPANQDSNYGPGGPGSNMYGSAGQPVLLDRWGQVIQYFPRYGPANNRTNDSNSVYPLNLKVQAGPLFGYSQPNSVDTIAGKPSNAGENAIWDPRDGAPFFAAGQSSNVLGSWPNPNPVTGNSDQVEPWPKPTGSSIAFQPELTIEWMLGKQDLSVEPNLIEAAGEKLNYDGPYILISAGPDGPERNNGGYCNMVDPNSGSANTPLPVNQLQQTFLASGNIYNFDRP
jgi:prepilin-type N-terminal cleavage/methylation domain-containing protein